MFWGIDLFLGIWIFLMVCFNFILIYINGKIFLNVYNEFFLVEVLILLFW